MRFIRFHLAETILTVLFISPFAAIAVSPSIGPGPPPGRRDTMTGVGDDEIVRGTGAPVTFR